MSFRVFLHPKAAKTLGVLEASVRERIKQALKELEESPESRGERIHPSIYWRIRVGDYRAIYEVDRRTSRVVVLYIGHRKNVYDDFERLL